MRLAASAAVASVVVKEVGERERKMRAAAQVAAARSVEKMVWVRRAAG